MDIRFAYVAPAVPFFFLAAAYGAKRLSCLRLPRLGDLNSYAPRIVLLMAMSLFFYFHIKRPIRSHPFHPRSNLHSIRTAAALVPPHASLSADNHLGAHFAKRRILRLTPQTRHKSGSVDYVLVDLCEDEFKKHGWLRTIRSFITTENYSPVFFSDGVVLLKKSAGPSPITLEVLQYIDRGEQEPDVDVRNRVGSD